MLSILFLDIQAYLSIEKTLEPQWHTISVSNLQEVSGVFIKHFVPCLLLSMYIDSIFLTVSLSIEPFWSENEISSSQRNNDRGISSQSKFGIVQNQA